MKPRGRVVSANETTDEMLQTFLELVTELMDRFGIYELQIATDDDQQDPKQAN